jgi:hypothetical protein
VKQQQASKYQAEMRTKEAYKSFLEGQLQLCHKGSRRGQQLEYRYAQIVHYENQICLPGGASDRRMLAISLVHKELGLLIAEVNSASRNRMSKLGASIGAICNALNVDFDLQEPGPKGGGGELGAQGRQ